MRLFLCGGGSRPSTDEALSRLNEMIDHTKPILYIPLAMESSKYEECFEWIHTELENVEVTEIDMVYTANEITFRNLEDYSALFIGGGNTYKLLKDLKVSGAFEQIKKYIENDGIVFGGSAGAIIFGADIDSCSCMDENTVGLEDTNGFNAFNNISLYCHYNNDEDTLNAKNHLEEYSINSYSVMAIPEEDTIYYHNGIYEIIGENPYYYFEKGEMISFISKEYREKEYNKVKSPEDLMEFMNHNIAYGWLDKGLNKHINNLKYFRQTYRISTIDEIISTGLATCLGQAKFIKYSLEKMGYETKLYCSRKYEIENDYEKKVEMHSFVLYSDGDKWYHFEHSNIPRRGILEYNSVEEALIDEMGGVTSSNDRVLTEIVELPDKLSFKEVNEYVNQFSKVNFE